jgi:galactonate dehydratase
MISFRPDRRQFLKTLPAYAALSMPVSTLLAQESNSGLRVIDIRVHVVSVTSRTNWIIVQLLTNQGITGLGEASLGRRAELFELAEFFELVRDESPFAIARFRERGFSRLTGNDRVRSTAFSAIEQALWDLCGKALEIPVYQFFGGKLRDQLTVYANINRATVERTPEGFAASAVAAVSDGFQAIKAAPFDGFPPLDAPVAEISRATDLGVAAVYAMREAVGPGVAIKIDAHSFFDVDLAIEVADQLERADLSWYEEPVAPTLLEETVAIRNGVPQVMAGGEFLFGRAGFRELCVHQAVNIIMPDIKHCGGAQELFQIATMADAFGVAVSPHNPSGPVSTAASASLCAAMPNFDILELQWGEADWRSELLQPGERINKGILTVTEAPGWGISLNQATLESHAL